MRNRNKIDPMVAKTMRKVAKSQNNKVLHFSLTVGKRVVCHKAIRPSTRAEYLRLKANRNASDADLNAVSAKLLNSEEGLFCELRVDGRMTAYDLGKFGRDIEYGWLRINNRSIEKVYTPEGLTQFLAAELS